MLCEPNLTQPHPQTVKRPIQTIPAVIVRVNLRATTVEDSQSTDSDRLQSNRVSRASHTRHHSISRLEPTRINRFISTTIRRILDCVCGNGAFAARHEHAPHRAHQQCTPRHAHTVCAATTPDWGRRRPRRQSAEGSQHDIRPVIRPAAGNRAGHTPGTRQDQKRRARHIRGIKPNTAANTSSNTSPNPHIRHHRPAPLRLAARRPGTCHRQPAFPA